MNGLPGNQQRKHDQDVAVEAGQHRADSRDVVVVEV